MSITSKQFDCVLGAVAATSYYSEWFPEEGMLSTVTYGLQFFALARTIDRLAR